MKLISGDILWSSINEVPKQYPSLVRDIECDVLIIGGGVTGALASYYLSENTFDVVVVEKNIVGYGSTRASTSILQYEVDTDLYGLSHMIGEKKAVAAFKLCEQGVYDIENIISNLGDNCDFRLNECLYYTQNSSKVSYMKKEYELRKKHGFSVEFLENKNEVQGITVPIHAGIYSYKGSAEIDPYRFTHSLISKAIERGVKVYENTEVKKIKPNFDNVVVETINNFKIKAKKVIIASGYESIEYFNKKLANMFRTFTIVTKPINKLQEMQSITMRDDKDAYTYIRTTGDNRIIIGGDDEKIGKETSNMANLSNDDKASEVKYNILYEKLKKFYPQFSNMEIDYKFSGIFAVTKDGLPHIGEKKDMPNCYFIMSYGSNGILYSTIGAKLLTDLFSGNKRKELEIFRYDR
ncbi:FAD-binding oxidoreductase [Clostridium sp. D2Q-11]|uniref:FAD-binding oxidoreductase n=1 Tax=Anaeromonas frigoriresistens TaxID=2683708 RepID=A0A942Z9P0_9FIRM|nr:FAD-dependent oxidoreductase [Anaeromonas frigoriresistens]MBS4539528.1 FAD-binding oxidoreductase [Anaeromonas frigoriresistens]